MRFDWQTALLFVAGLFLLFLLVKMRPRLGGRLKLGATIRAARDKAHAAKTDRGKAEALLEAGEACAHERRWTAAAGFFLRAMNADSAWPDAVERTVAGLAKRRPRVLEQILWRRLAHLPWDDEHRGAARAAGAALAHLYRHSIRDAARAEVLQRLARDLAEPRPKAG